MPSPSTELQGALYQALTGSTELMAIVSAVHDRVPEKPVFPYLTIGDDNLVQLNASCVTSNEHTFSVHIWSRAVGGIEAKEIGHLVRLAVPETFNLPTHAATDIVFRTEREIGDPDGLTSHRIITFFCRVEVRP